MSCTIALAEDLFETARPAAARRNAFKPQPPTPNLFELPPDTSRRWLHEHPPRCDEDAERWDGLS